MARRIEYNFIENAGGFEPISKSSFVVGKQYDADSKSMACHTPEQSTNATTSPFTISFFETRRRTGTRVEERPSFVIKIRWWSATTYRLEATQVWLGANNLTLDIDLLHAYNFSPCPSLPSPSLLTSPSPTSPLITCPTNFNASTAKLTIFSSLSLDPVSTSFVHALTPSSPFFTTANATYPGVLFLVSPPVGPAVPDSETVYVDCRVLSVCVASPVTMAGVGPE